MTVHMGDDIMDFINDVARVVHENVSTWGGQCNKNLGGSFLMTWKIPEGYTRGSANVDVSRIPYVAKVADRALIGFLRVIADLNRDERILAYRDRAGLNIVDPVTGVSTPFKVRCAWRWWFRAVWPSDLTLCPLILLCPRSLRYFRKNTGSHGIRSPHWMGHRRPRWVPAEGGRYLLVSARQHGCAMRDGSKAVACTGTIWHGVVFSARPTLSSPYF